MVSQTAKEDIQALWADGLRPSVEDIIRLNALGLRLERSPCSAESLFYLRRVAWLGDVAFYQPTMGHEIWLDNVSQIMDMADSMTSLAVTALACTVADADDLPKPSSKVRVLAALIGLKIRLRKYTVQQVVNSVRYVTDGNSGESYEYPPPRPSDEEETPEEDGAVSIPAGILLDGIATGLGISVDDARKLTQGQYRTMVQRYMKRHGMIDEKRDQGETSGDYFRTLDTIKARLIAERDGGKE